MDSSEQKKELLLDVVRLLSKALDLNEGRKLDHGQRVANLAHALAQQLRSVNTCQLYLAGLLHDIGGMGLKEHVLHYALEDFQDIEAREHTIRGYSILTRFHPFISFAGWIRDHHERYDGAGFPAAKSKQDISQEAEILHLADLLDVFRNSRQTLSRDDVLHFIERQSGRAVSPVVAAAAKRLFRDDENMRLLTGPLPETLQGRDLALHLPGFANFTFPELQCQLLWLTAHVIDTKHLERRDNSIMVAYFSHLIARGLNASQLDPLEVLWAALLHNLGLAAVPQEDLNLDYDVRPEISALYRRHPLIAAELTTGIRSLSHLAPALAAHHEHHDGTGFPGGLKGEHIPLTARIIAIVDTYLRLAGEAPRHEKRHRFALAFLNKGKGTLFDPSLLAVAIPILDHHGRHDLGWLRDLPNVHAFFTQMPGGESTPGHAPGHGPATVASSLFPRQWQLATLSADLQIQSGSAGLSRLAGRKNCRSLTTILSPNSLTELKKELQAMGTRPTLTLTLRSRTEIPLELVFIKEEHGFSLLSRGANSAPVYAQRATVFFHNFITGPEAGLLLDHQAVIREVNTSFCKYFHLPAAALVNTTILQLFQPFLPPDESRSLHRFFTTRESEIWSGELPFITGAGRHVTIQATLSRVDGLGDDTTTFLCRIIDISAKKQIEQELIRRDNELQAIVHNTTGMTGKKFFESLLYRFILLTRARIGMISELADDGRTVIPHIFWESNQFWPPPDRFTVHSSPCQLVIKRGEIYFPDRLHEFFPAKFLLQDRNISSYWGLPLRNQEGSVIGILSLYDDKPILHSRNMQAIARIFQARIASELARQQTEQVLQEKDRQLELQNSALVRMNQFKSDMIAITSHDLKAPLSAMIGYASLLQEHSATLTHEKKAHYTRRIQDEGQKQLTFINKLLDLYRIESGNVELSLVPYRLDILLASSLSSLRELARTREITFAFTASGTLTSFPVDPLRIGQVFNNLLTNAIKFSPDKGKIAVDYLQDDNQATISIADQGQGIDEEEIAHIFDRYYMGRTNFQIRPEGSGLGLYIVRNIIKLHGGTVTAHNNRTGGSCFTLILPTNNPQLATHHDHAQHSYH